MKKLFFIFFLLSISQINSHEFNPAHLVIKEVETNTYQTEWMYPAKNIGARGEVLFPQDCIRENTQFEKNGRYLVEAFSLICESTLKGQKINVKSLDSFRLAPYYQYRYIPNFLIFVQI